MRKRILAVAFVLTVLAAVTGCINLGVLGAGELEVITVEESPRWFEWNRVAVIDVDGFIAPGDGAWFFSITTVADVKAKLKRAAEDEGVRAVVLRINSPGGEVTACDMIYEEILAFKRETGKPVVASLLGIATSGGYYVAIAADKIVAAPTTVTGSVGVIMEFVNVEGLFGKIGLRPEIVKSGEKKDIGSPVRAMTAEEREILQGVNRALFNRFVRALRSGRPEMTDREIAAISDGRILFAEQAMDLHMVDLIGYPEDAIAEARQLAGIETADVILYRAWPYYNANIYARAPGGLLEQGLEFISRRSGPMFLYLWSPGR